jgi:ribonucleoside-diphosphate reductase alpha chain
VQQELLGASPTTQMTQTPPAGTPRQVMARSSTGELQQVAMFEGVGDKGQAFIGTCPDCGSQLEFAEGCVKCHVCGFSECG